MNGLVACRFRRHLFASICISIGTVTAVCPSAHAEGRSVGLSAGPSAAHLDSPFAGEVIRCPHWQSFAPPVHLATAAEKKTLPGFDAALAKAGSTHATQTANPVRAAKQLASVQKAAPVLQAAPVRQAAAPATAHTSPCRPPHTVREGETLFSIAATRLGDGRRWPQIRAVNGDLDPARLRPGMVLAMPCAAGGVQKGTAQNVKAGAKGSRESSRAGQAAATPASTPVKDLPVWTAKRGEEFTAVMQRWAKTAGYTVIVETTDAWTLAVPVRLTGDFRDAVGNLVRGLAHDGTAPPVRIHPNNVVRIGL